MILHREWMAQAVGEYVSTLDSSSKYTGAAQFRHLCASILAHVLREISDENDADYGAEAYAGALLGKRESVRYFQNKIQAYLKDHKIGNVEYPPCYKSLVDAIYHELWGFSVLAEWFDMPDCESAKVIGERIYYMINGRMVLQPYTLPNARRLQLKNNLLMNTPQHSRMDDHVEMNLLTGERITLYDNRMTKTGYDTIVFRKYVVKNYSWSEQARRGTIHKQSIELMERFARVGLNVIFTGPVRSGKTTMLETWQACEDQSLEGVTIEETDEVRFDKLTPGSPIMQLLNNYDDEDSISKPILRSDADYLVLAEARNGAQFDLMVRLANKGTNRCKTTMHTTHVKELLYDIADEIMAIRPNAQYESTLMKCATAYHYILQLNSLYSDKSQKRLMGIYEICPSRIDGTIELVRICEYDVEGDTWRWNYHVGEDKEEIARKENYKAFLAFRDELKKLAAKYPIKGDGRVPVYHNGRAQNA